MGIEAKNLRTAMKNYKIKNHPHHFLYNFIPHFLTALICSLFCSCPFWLPSMRHFVFITIPDIRASLLNPKCLFIVVNTIVAFLLSESKRGALRFSTTAIYEEYVKKNQSWKRLSALAGSKNVKESEMFGGEEERVIMNKIDNRVVDEVRGHDKKEIREEPSSDDHGDEKREISKAEDEEDGVEKTNEQEDQDGIPAEELNKRVEEFIARVNRQRWIEARASDVC